MARTELPNGIILPAEYSDDWYNDMTSNLSKLDEVIGSDAEKLSDEDVGAAALSNDYTDLDNKPSIPTKTSDLTNDSNFVDNTDPAVASGITSAKVTDYDTHLANTDIHVTAADKQKWNNGVSQAYVLRYASTSVTPSSTIAYSVLNNTDNIKVGDSVIDASGQVFLIASVDSVNQTVTVSAVLLTLALDANVMHLSGNETAGGKKTFSEYITSDGSSTGDEYSNNAKTNFWLLANRDTEDVSGILIDSYRQNTLQGTGGHILGISIKENGIRYEGCRIGWIWNSNLNGYSFSFRPTLQGANQAVEHNLGLNTDKWDTINGINPGALSLPDLSSGVDISGSITNFGAETVNEYTPLADGWISIANSGDSPIFIRVYNDYGFEQVAYSERNDVGGTSGGTYTRFGSIMIPCIKNVKIYIIVSPSSSVLVSAKFFPCKGNV